MDAPATLGAALVAARGRIPQSEARLFLRAIAGMSAAQFAAYPERDLTPAQAARFADWLTRRTAGEPVAYLLGEREFYGRCFRVTPATLIPRPETELIVDWAKTRLAPDAPARVLDLGTGSGALAVTLALEWPAAAVTGIDRSPAALAVAAANGAALGASVRWLESDWCAALEPAERFDLIVSNPPYVAADDPHLAEGDVRFEPRSALASGPRGLDDIARIAVTAPPFLVPGGWLIVEHGYDQAEAVRALLAEQGLGAVDSARDLAGIERISFGRCPDGLDALRRGA